jgi:hypothetical protein
MRWPAVGCLTKSNRKIDHDGIDPSCSNIGEQLLQSRPVHRRAGEPTVIISQADRGPGEGVTRKIFFILPPLKRKKRRCRRIPLIARIETERPAVGFSQPRGSG